MVDDDATLENDTLVKLFEAHLSSGGDAVLVAAQPLHLEGEIVTNCFEKLPSKDCPQPLQVWTDWTQRKEEKIKIEACGFGCVWMPMAALIKIGAPWFVEDHGELCTHKGRMTEDIFFGRRCKEEEVPMYAIVGAHVGHLGKGELREFVTRKEAMRREQWIYSQFRGLLDAMSPTQASGN